MSDNSAVIAALESLQAQACCDRQRRMVVLSGQRPWALELLSTFFYTHDVSRGIWLGSDSPSPPLPVVGEDIHAVLGKNLSWAVIDVWEGLNPDALAAVVGAVTGGGLVILTVPPRQQWRHFIDPDYQRLLVHPFTIGALSRRFLDHIIATLEADKAALWIEQGQSLPKPLLSVTEVSPPNQGAGIAATTDQNRAIDAVVHVLEGHSRRPLIITSDRGRGKSSALGIASTRMMQAGRCRLVVTAPRLAAVLPVFEHAAQGLGLAPISLGTSRIDFGDSSLCFLPPDELLHSAVELDLLMVDEAAAIPAPMLKALVQRYNRMVFSTTVHGYEGTGRGFDVRFKKALPALVNQVREVVLTQPVRWAENDPVESWLYRALLLDARPAELSVSDYEAHPCTIGRVDRDNLLQQPGTLSELFGLLVLSHYQTTPSDLRNLLDGPNISLWLARCKGRVAGAVLVAEEGRFEPSLAKAVGSGQRRPRGHLLPQTLAAHVGLESAPRLCHWRIMRIAVHPELQRNGIGRRLIEAVTAAAREEKIDCVGSSFAATADTLAFWRSQQYVPLRLGLKRDASSGCHSVIVLSALSREGEALLERARNRFAEQFPRQLEHTFGDIEWSLVEPLLAGLPVFDGYRLGQQDWLDIAAFVEGGRQFDDCRLALWKLVIHSAQYSLFEPLLLESQKQLVIARVLQNLPRQTVCKRLGLSGKSALQQQLRSAVALLYRALREKN